MRMKMMRTFKHLFFALFFMFIFFEAFDLAAQQGFDSSQLERLRSDPKLQYDIEPQVADGSLERLWQRFLSFIDSLLGGTVGNILFRLLLAAAVVYFLIRLVGVELTAVFKPEKSTRHYPISEENLETADLEEELEKAKQLKDWRLVVRLIYLKALKLMWESEMVSLRKGKTNREYLYELEGKAIASPFESLSFLFDYTWYGHFEATETMSRKAENYFEEMFKKGNE